MVTDIKVIGTHDPESTLSEPTPAPSQQHIEVPAAQSLSRNPFKRLKQRRQKAKAEEERRKEDEIPDPREPKLKPWAHWTIYRTFGLFNWFLILLGCIGAAGAGVIPLTFQFVLGDLINALGANTTADSLRAT